MITLLGSHETAEYAAASRLRDLIATAWPHVVDRADADVTLIAGVKCYGQRTIDVDLVVLVNLPHPYRAGDHQGKPLSVRSLCLTIEVKNSPPQQVAFEGNKVLVKYRNQDAWHDASEQSFGQMNALRNYLQANGMARQPFVVNLIWLRQIPEASLPTVTHNILGSNTTWPAIIQQVTTSQNPIQTTDGYELRAMRDMQHHTIQQATSILTKRLEITPLDRRKIEAITRKVLHNQAYVDALLKQAQLLIFRGRGGTGKTVRLLQLAHQLYQEQDARVLILTYNVALVSDIKRLLHLMGIKQGMDRRRIFIQTVHAFVYRVLRGMELLDEHTRDFITRYDDYKRELLDMYQEGALAAHDLHTMMHANPEDFSYDYVMVDEAQDWPPDERDLLFAMYDYRQCVLAHGYDQLVRGQQETDWRATIPRGTSQIVSLKRSLRLKAGLCEVVNSIAEALGLQDWNVQPDQQVYGGRVIIVEGAYRQPLHATLLQRLREHGNEPIDMLCCVPPTMVMEQGYPFAQQLHEWGYAVWDGTDEATRHEHPTSVQQHRVVQYDSCRGLEGWTAVHLGFDELYNYKYNDYTPTDTEATDIFFDHASSAHDYAIRWMMIPLTRAIDTLVLHITSADHPVGTALSTAAQRHRELVDWIRASPGRSEQA